MLAAAAPEIRRRLGAYGEKLGLLFQVTDDILNVDGDANVMGKATGSDARRRKAAYPAVAGMAAARARAGRLCAEAREVLAGLDGEAEASVLAEIAGYVMRRSN